VDFKTPLKKVAQRNNDRKPINKVLTDKTDIDFTRQKAILTLREMIALHLKHFQGLERE
jgi:hypothetical protein